MSPLALRHYREKTLDDEQTRPLNQAPRHGAPQQYPSPYAGYVSQELSSDGRPPSGAHGGPGSEQPWDPFDGYSSSYGDEARSPRRGKGGWLIPVVIVLLGVAAFGAVMMLLSRGPGHDGTTAGPSVGQLSPSSRVSASQEATSQEPSAEESSAGSTPEESSSESASSDTTSAAAADFPADTGTACLGGTIADADIQIRNGTGSSCAYVSAIKSQVLAHLAEDPQATVFTVSPYSVARREYVSLTCSRSDHLTRCTGGRNVDAYVKDRVG